MNEYTQKKYVYSFVLHYTWNDVPENSFRLREILQLQEHRIEYPMTPLEFDKIRIQFARMNFELHEIERWEYNKPEAIL